MLKGDRRKKPLVALNRKMDLSFPITINVWKQQGTMLPRIVGNHGTFISFYPPLFEHDCAPDCFIFTTILAKYFYLNTFHFKQLIVDATFKWLSK